MQPLRARVDLGAMVIKACSAFPKAPTSLEPHYQIVSCHILDTRCRGVLPLCTGAVYSTTPADWAISALVGYSMSNPVHTYVSNIFDL